MSKTMPNSTAEEKYRWIKPIVNKSISIKNMVKVCPFSERSIKYWLANYRKYGISGLENKSTRPKTNSNETPIRVKEEIIELRKETGECAKILAWKLKDKGINLHYQTINKIIKQKGITKKYRTRKKNSKLVKSFNPGDMIEIDVKYVPGRIEGKRYYQFTAIDCASRWRYLKIYEDQSNSNAIHFLKQIIQHFPYSIQAIKTDNGAIFTNRYTGYLKSRDILNPRLHELDILCEKLEIEHYLIDPGKPAQNGRVERSHRSDQEKFYDQVHYSSLEELKYKIRLWNMYYNNLQHCALNGKTPNQILGIS